MVPYSQFLNRKQATKLHFESINDYTTDDKHYANLFEAWLAKWKCYPNCPSLSVDEFCPTTAVVNVFDMTGYNYLTCFSFNNPSSSSSFIGFTIH